MVGNGIKGFKGGDFSKERDNNKANQNIMLIKMKVFVLRNIIISAIFNEARGLARKGSNILGKVSG